MYECAHAAWAARTSPRVHATNPRSNLEGFVEQQPGKGNTKEHNLWASSPPMEPGNLWPGEFVELVDAARNCCSSSKSRVESVEESRGPNVSLRTNTDRPDVVFCFSSIAGTKMPGSKSTGNRGSNSREALRLRRMMGVSHSHSHSLTVTVSTCDLLV